MQFLLLLPELPHAHDGGLLDRDGNAGRFSAVRHGRSLVLSAANAIRRRLGVRQRRPELIELHLS